MDTPNVGKLLALLYLARWMRAGVCAEELQARPARRGQCSLPGSQHDCGRKQRAPGNSSPEPASYAHKVIPRRPGVPANRGGGRRLGFPLPKGP